MTVTSFAFFAFLTIGMAVYYALPKFQWMILLFLSICFYLSAAVPYTFIFPVISAILAYLSTMAYSRYKDDEGKKKVLLFVTVFAIAVNVALWFFLKGSSFWISGSNLIRALIPSFPLLSPLPIVGAMGMAYYTSQVIGYVLDVYWGNTKPQRNFFKLLLFVVFFPQMTVGPISRYEHLKSLFERHHFRYQNICFGVQRILWGVFKKIVISDRTGILVDSIWASGRTGFYPWIAVLLYPLQIYTDFSGCMDIVIGGAELFDIRLPENFKNPFFSRTSQEFWQRWHITLGTWARDYIYYPVLKSRILQKIGKKSRDKFGRKKGKLIPWTIGMAILWFVMGFWHGGIQHIFGVSLWFFIVIVLSERLNPLFHRANEILGIQTESFSWHLFQSIRTYFIYALGAVFFSAPGLHGALAHYKALIVAVTKPNIWIFFDGSILDMGVTWDDIHIIIFGTVMLFVVGVLRERYGYARDWMRKQILVFRWFVWLFLFAFTLVYGLYGPGYDASIFIYEGF